MVAVAYGHWKQKRMKTLYIYLDESGNFDFSARGTEHFVLCAMTTLDPISTQEPLQVLKYELLEEGHDIEYFHASEDRQEVRNRVFDRIKVMKEPSFHFVYAKKDKADPSVRTPSMLYALLSRMVLSHCLRSGQPGQVDQIVVIFDRALTRKRLGSAQTIGET